MLEIVTVVSYQVSSGLAESSSSLAYTSVAWAYARARACAIISMAPNICTNLALLTDTSHSLS